MKTFYKIVNGNAQIGSGDKTPAGFKLYEVGAEPQELIDGLAYKSLEDIVSHFTAITDTHIQSQVDAYNTANNTAFSNVHNCESYSRITGYSHQAFCLAVWTWSVEVWETVRAYQEGLTESPTDAEFQAVLDSVVVTW